MGSTTDVPKLIEDLNRTLPFLARDALAASVAAGTLPGPEGIALAGRLREIAAADTHELEGIAARVASLGGSPVITLERMEAPKTWRAAVRWLVKMQRQTLDALVEAIPADADDQEGEATEHLLEHVIARKRDGLEILERAIR